MKVEFYENEYNSWFEIEPETAQETAQLFRMVNNSVAEKPRLYLSFGANENESIHCNVCIKKLNKKSNKVRNYTSNY